MKKTLFAVVISLFHITAFGQAPVYSNAFLTLGVGARGLAMSNSYVATTNDVTSGYWNPAGLLGINDTSLQVSLMHSEYFAGIAKYDYGAVAKRLDSTSVLAFTVVRFAVDDIPNTTQLINSNGQVNYNAVTSFSATDFAAIMSYAKKLKIPNLRLGGSVKVIRRTVGDFAGAWGFGLDFGAQYDYKKWKFAAMVRDATSTFNAWSFNLSDSMKNTFAATGNALPTSSVEITLPTLLLGTARKFDFTKNISLLAEVDIDVTFDGQENVLIQGRTVCAEPHMGVEASYMNFIFLRGGIGNYQRYTNALGQPVNSVQPNIGLGVRIRSITIDYALTNIGDQSGGLYSNVFSLKFDINKDLINKGINKFK